MIEASDRRENSVKGLWNSDWVEGEDDFQSQCSSNEILKPGRYSGGEINAVVRPGVHPAIALCFPDVYEIGMSHLGIKVLYEEVNRDPRFRAERVFAPWRDMGAKLRKEDIPLTSLETKTPLSNFDVIGFSLSYELSYPDILEMLDLGGVPIRREGRSGKDPIVIAGGHCALHAAPLRPFLDGVFLGEADEAIVEIMNALNSAKGLERPDRIRVLAEIDGLHLYDDEVERVKTRRVFYGFDESRGVTAPVVSNVLSVHDRVAVEIQRGCTRGCRFCQAGYITRPQRYRAPAVIEESAMDALKSSGYDEISLISLSACDHPSISEIARSLTNRIAARNVSIAIPSTRVDAFDVELNKLASSARRTGITLAPEVGNEKMDRIINKGSDPKRLVEAVREAFENGWRRVKLYYLIGNPFETLDDARDIGLQIESLLPYARKHNGMIRASVSVLCPKPWTPFQWMGMERVESLREKQKAIRSVLPKNSNHVEVDMADPKSSLIEAALARGGEELSDVIEGAWRAGLTLQSWGEFFEIGAWENAFASSGRSLYDDAYRGYELSEDLPWEDISIGIEKSFLLREWKATERAGTGGDRFKTEDCSTGACYNCGQPCVGTHPVVPAISAASIRADNEPGRADSEPEIGLTNALNKTISFRYAKYGESLAMGHLDLKRAFERSLRRCGFAMATSQGFNPRLKLRFALALPLGVEAESEYGEVVVSGVTPSEFVSKMNNSLPDGIRIVEAGFCERTVNIEVMKARYRIEGASENSTALIHNCIDNSRNFSVIKKRRTLVREKILGDFLLELEADGKGVNLSLLHTSQGSFSISDVISLIRAVEREIRVVRTGLELR